MAAHQTLPNHRKPVRSGSSDVPGTLTPAWLEREIADAEHDLVENASRLNGSHPLTTEVIGYLTEYSGANRFLSSLKGWLSERPLTPNQVAAVTQGDDFWRWRNKRATAKAVESSRAPQEVIDRYGRLPF